MPVVSEFGCGTGHNLLALSRQHPNTVLVGFDWAESAVKAVNRLLADHDVNIIGKRFDFFSPGPALKFIRGSGVLTVGALEQVGSRFGAFLSFLLSCRPAVCVHMEPVVELYDEGESFDHLAACYHRMRGYLEGYLPALRRLEKARRAEILAVKRNFFGSLYHEAYTCIAWRPTGG
jgi:hypothetical protein